MRRAGYEGTTLKRVGRAAGSASTSAYSCYETREVMMRDFMIRMVEVGDAIARTWHEALPVDDLPQSAIRDAAASLQAGWAHPDAVVRRRLLLELALQLQHDDWLVDVLVDTRVGVAGTRGSSTIAGDRSVALGSCIATGTALLADLASRLHEVDWRPFSAAVLALGAPGAGRDAAAL
jgi:AcrR family transcriptional regulator